MLAPVVERLNNELLNPSIKHIFAIAWRKGLLPPPPQKLQGRELKIKYISTLAQAQRMLGITAIEQTVGFIGAQAELSPTIVDMINYDNVAIEYSKAMGVSPNIINSPESVAKLRAARAKQQQQLQQQALMANAADAAAKGAKATKDMSQAPMGENTALDSLLAGIKGAAPQ